MPKNKKKNNRRSNGTPPQNGSSKGGSATPAAASGDSVKVEVRADTAIPAMTKRERSGASARSGGPRLPKYWYAVIGVGVVTVVLWGLLFATRFFGESEERTVANVAVVEDSRGANLLNGVPVDAEKVGAWPVAIMFDNHPSARPHLGIGNARIIYETFVEGGATRFMGIFDSFKGLENIGPVRSARHYFVEIAEQYQAAYVHAGQSPQASHALDVSKVVKDVNLIGSGAKYGHRDATRRAPHNLFTDRKRMIFMEKDKRILDRQVPIESWLFTDEPALEDRPETPLVVTVDLPGRSYDGTFSYHREKNAFERRTAGELHVDATTGEVLSPKTVAIVHVPPEVPLGEKGRIDFDVSGEGPAELFFNGRQVNATFRQPTLQDRMRFYDASGAEIAFPPGLVWIVILPGDRTVTVEGGPATEEPVDDASETAPAS